MMYAIPLRKSEGGGGEKSHIGSISVSEKGGEAFSISVLEHKDYIMSSEAARKIAEATGRRCLVVVGIHVEEVAAGDQDLPGEEGEGGDRGEAVEGPFLSDVYLPEKISSKDRIK